MSFALRHSVYAVLLCGCIALSTVFAEPRPHQNNGAALNNGAASESGGALYMPSEVAKAYSNATRSRSGHPGPRYWQNRTDYSISAEIDPATRTLRGKESIRFHNNSPDTLKTIVVQLHQNMNKKGGIRNALLADEAVSDGVEISRVTVAGKARSTDPKSQEVTIEGAVMYVNPGAPLPPGSVTGIEIDWSFVIPKGSNIRMGTYETGAFFLGYWFPKIAVYDDVYGWDTFAYNGEHEFYNEYGDYRVEIRVPSSYGVWATGELDNPAEILKPANLEKYRAAMKAETVVAVVSKADVESGGGFQARDGFNTWKYTATNVPDYAFGIAEDYRWDMTSVDVGGRRASVHAVYDTATAPFELVADEAAQSLAYFSKEFPAVPYPYPQITVFRGDYGMEFPMIVNDGVFPSRVMNVYVHTHEIAHQYFPFYVGTNETMYAWMDEGWAYALPVEIQKRLSKYDHRIRAVKGYENYAGSTYDLPLMTPSTCLRSPHLEMASYFKPAVAYELLKGVMGEQSYTAAMQEYVRRWNGKHPLPYDFFHTFDDVSGEDLAWFWQPWFFGEGIPDLGIKEVIVDGNRVRILVENIGAKPIPVDISITPETGDPVTLQQSAALWKNGAREVWLDAVLPARVKSVTLGSVLIPDSNPANNTWQFEG